MEIAHFLEKHPQVHTVHYPGLTSHPGHKIVQKQMSGFGGMLSIQVKGGADMAAKIAAGTQIFTQATSLGGVESLVCHPASMTHAPVQSDALKRAGIGSNLIRLSVGLESADDLIEDLLAALDAASAANDQFQHRPLALQK